MFIQTYLKFYQEYSKMVCSVLKGSFSGIEFVKKLPIGPFSQIRSQIRGLVGSQDGTNIHLSVPISLYYLLTYLDLSVVI